jgi:hypothetical protein
MGSVGGRGRHNCKNNTMAMRTAHRSLLCARDTGARARCNTRTHMSTKGVKSSARMLQLHVRPLACCIGGSRLETCRNLRVILTS